MNSAKCFSILDDETCDISTIDQLSSCVKYVDEENDKKVYEKFLQFIPASSITGKTFLTNIRKIKVIRY